MSRNIIAREVVREIDETIAVLATEWQESKAMLLTEFDLQAQLFARLSSLPTLKGIFPTHNDAIKTVKVHGELSWYDSENKYLSIVPDITILEPQGLSITDNLFVSGEKLPSKGCTFLGEAIIFEVKFHRGNNILDGCWRDEIARDSMKIRQLTEKFRDSGFGNRNKIYSYQILFDRSLHPENKKYFKEITQHLTEFQNFKRVYANFSALDFFSVNLEQ